MSTLLVTDTLPGPPPRSASRRAFISEAFDFAALASPLAGLAGGVCENAAVLFVASEACGDMVGVGVVPVADVLVSAAPPPTN